MPGMLKALANPRIQKRNMQFPNGKNTNMNGSIESNITGVD
jgi:hypothetical protein